MTRAPLLLPAALLIAGILAERSSIVPVALAAVALVFVPIGPATQRCVAYAALSAGILVGVWHGRALPLASEIPDATVSGVVTSDVTHRAWGYECELTSADGMRIELTSRTALAPGDRLTARGRLEPFDEPRNPGEASSRDLAAENGRAARLANAEILAREPAATLDLVALLPRARAWASTILRKRIPEPDASILAGALWGERASLPREVKREFQETGTVHILVTAGLHLGVIAMLMSVLCTALGVPRVAAALASIIAIWSYAAASGAHLPSLRAATMITVALGARACGARAFSWNALAAAAIVVATLWPAAVGGASFALSFSCVAAIVLFADPIARWCEGMGVMPFAAEACALTIATQIGVWPLTAQTFLTVAPYAIVANLAVVPVVGSTMLLGIAQIVADRIPFVPDVLAALDTGLLDWIVAVVETIAALPGAQLAIAPPPTWAIACYDAAALCAATALAKGRAVLALFALIAGTLIVIVPGHGTRGPLTITALDVGQGDGIVVRTPHGHTFMVDTGGRLEIGGSDEESSAELVGERIVVPYLIRSGIRHVDGIILTHPHGDHVGGCAPILRELGADWIADGGQAYGGHAYQDCIARARAQNVPIREPRAGEVWRTDDGVTLRFLAPSEPYFANTGDDVNENSIVFMLEYNGFRALFMGDAGQNTEARLLASGFDLRADVLKVGHHGSAYASTPAFIAAVGPRIAIISVGRHNHFGHPAPRTLATLRDAHAAILRTDRCGAVTVTPHETTTMLTCSD